MTYITESLEQEKYRKVDKRSFYISLLSFLKESK